MLADHIAQLINEMLNEKGGELEIKRNEMAGMLGCVPSQISYVITSRFTPERGYIVESRRGGGGCIRIIRKQMHRNEYLMHFFYAIGNEISEAEANAYIDNLLGKDMISSKEAWLISSALSESAMTALPKAYRTIARASVFKHMILSLMN